MYICTYRYIHVRIYISMNMFVNVNTHTYIYIFTYTHEHAHIYSCSYVQPEFEEIRRCWTLLEHVLVLKQNLLEHVLVLKQNLLEHVLEQSLLEHVLEQTLLSCRNCIAGHRDPWVSGSEGMEFAGICSSTCSSRVCSSTCSSRLFSRVETASRDTETPEFLGPREWSLLDSTRARARAQAEFARAHAQADSARARARAESAWARARADSAWARARVDSSLVSNLHCGIPRPLSFCMRQILGVWSFQTQLPRRRLWRVWVRGNGVAGLCSSTCSCSSRICSNMCSSRSYCFRGAGVSLALNSLNWQHRWYFKIRTVLASENSFRVLKCWHPRILLALTYETSFCF